MLGRGLIPVIPEEARRHRRPVHPSRAHPRGVHQVHHAPGVLGHFTGAILRSAGMQSSSFLFCGVPSLTPCVIRFLTGRVSRPRFGHKTPPHLSIEKHCVLQPTLCAEHFLPSFSYRSQLFVFIR